MRHESSKVLKQRRHRRHATAAWGDDDDGVVFVPNAEPKRCLDTAFLGGPGAK
jgi:hypothetical protein